MIKSYRGLLASGGQDIIRLSTTDGRMGYKLVKFEIMPLGVNLTIENVMKIYKTVQTSGTNVINFSDSDLLAAAILKIGSASTEALTMHVIFDNEVFNQDISVTSLDDGGGNRDCNYYIELEQIKLSSAQAELLIVKSLRGEVWTRP